MAQISAAESETSRLTSALHSEVYTAMVRLQLVQESGSVKLAHGLCVAAVTPLKSA